ncbi:MAG: acetate--CoA ligase family protein [Candidatus Marsarchaeota archaeon]|nr:acetate--CoA ligase family protein [Candidatus Marsarchaeota archaeon]
MDFALLRRYSIPILDYALASDLPSAVRAAQKIRYPVVLKLVSARFLHKSDAGALALNVRDRAVLEIEFKRLAKMGGNEPSTTILVQAYRPGRFELIVGGLLLKPQKPVVLLGSGGIYTEVLRDTSLRVCPLDREGARSMLRSLKSYPILAGMRGRKPMDEEALYSLLMRVSRLMERERPAELDLNPVLVRDDGLWVADVRVLR